MGRGDKLRSGDLVPRVLLLTFGSSRLGVSSHAWIAGPSRAGYYMWLGGHHGVSDNNSSSFIPRFPDHKATASHPSLLDSCHPIFPPIGPVFTPPPPPFWAPCGTPFCTGASARRTVLHPPLCGTPTLSKPLFFFLRFRTPPDPDPDPNPDPQSADLIHGPFLFWKITP